MSEERKRLKTLPERLTPAASEILPGLWIGDRLAAGDAIWLREKNITAVINCTRSQEFSKEAHLKQALRVPVRDNLEPAEIHKMGKYLGPVVAKIQEWLPNHNVLVHCYAGRQRSSAVIIAYLLKHGGGLELDEIIELLQSKRTTICKPKCNFYDALERFASSKS